MLQNLQLTIVRARYVLCRQSRPSDLQYLVLWTKDIRRNAVLRNQAQEASDASRGRKSVSELKGRKA